VVPNRLYRENVDNGARHPVGLVEARARHSRWFVGLRGRDQPIHIVRQFLQAYACGVLNRLMGYRQRWNLNRSADDECRGNCGLGLDFGCIHSMIFSHTRRRARSTRMTP
jgi:hypothetical protein